VQEEVVMAIVEEEEEEGQREQARLRRGKRKGGGRGGSRWAALSIRRLWWRRTALTPFGPSLLEPFNLNPQPSLPFLP